MERHAAELLRDALALPAEARAALIDSLIESLDPMIEEGAEEAWRREIEARLEQIDSGAVKLISWREASRRRGDRLGHLSIERSESIQLRWRKQLLLMVRTTKASRRALSR